MRKKDRKKNRLPLERKTAKGFTKKLQKTYR